MALDTATVRIAAKVAGEEAVRSLAKSLEITEKEAKQLIQTNLKLGSSSTQAAAGMTAASGAAAASARGFGMVRSAASALLSSLGPLVALLGVGSLAKMGMEAETASAKLRTMQGAIPDFNKLGPLLEQVAAETGNIVGPTEMAGAAYEVLSAGAKNAADAAAKLKAALILAQGGAVDTSVAVDGLTSVMNAYGVDTKRAGEVADKIRQTVDDGKISFEQYATQIGKVAAVAAGAGVSFDQVNAAIATITASGIQSESAISGLRQLIVNIIKPTDDAQKVAKAYGIELSAAALKSKGLVGVLEDIRTKTGGNSQAVSKLITDVDSLTAAQAIFGGQGAKFKELIDKQATSAGAASKAAKEMGGTTEAAVKRMQTAWEGLAKRLGEVFGPMFKVLANGFADLFQDIQKNLGGLDRLMDRTSRLFDRSNLGLARRMAFTASANFSVGRLFPGLQDVQRAINTTRSAGITSPEGFQQAKELVADLSTLLSRSINPSSGAAANRQAVDLQRQLFQLDQFLKTRQKQVAEQRKRDQQQRYDPITAGGGGTTTPMPDVDGPKPRTAEEIQASIRGLNVDAQVQQLQRLRLLADEYAKSQIDFTLAKDRAEQKFLELSGKKGITRPEVDAARKLRDAEITTAETVKKQAIAKVREDVAKVKTEADAALTTLREAIDPKALLERTKDDFVAAVDAQVDVLTEAVKTAVTQLKEARRRLLELGGPQAKDLIAQIDAKITANEKSLADPSGIRGIATDQVRARISQTLGADQQRELQQLQDQLQALLQPFGELTAVQQLELRLKRENIALSPEERAQRFADAAAIDKTREAIRQLNEQQQLSRQLAEGIADSFREMFKGLLFQAQSLEEALSNLFGRLADQLFNLAFNIGVFGNPFGFAGSIFGQVLPGFEKRAAGGPVSAGSPYIVGERGPEVFVPRTSGTIVPNGAGGVSVVVNVDAKGTSVQGNDPQGQQLGRVVSAAVQAEIMRQQRPGGLLAGGRR